MAPRPQPFDVSVGTDARGAPVATFSRCIRTPKMRDVGETGVAGGSLVEPGSGSGCRIHVLELTTGRESRLPIPGSAGTSDTSPSMWRGSVVFARKAPRHGDVWQVMLWSSSHRGAVSTLHHGAFLSNCQTDTFNCGGRGPARGEVEALDRDGSLVTFLWAVKGPGVVGEGGWELRVDNLANGRSSLAAAGSGHEACTGLPVGLEYVWPEAPVANGRLALFSQLEGYSCFKRFASVLGSYQPGAKYASSGPARRGHARPCSGRRCDLRSRPDAGRRCQRRQSELLGSGAVHAGAPRRARAAAGTGRAPAAFRTD